MTDKVFCLKAVWHSRPATQRFVLFVGPIECGSVWMTIKGWHAFYRIIPCSCGDYQTEDEAKHALMETVVDHLERGLSPFKTGKVALQGIGGSRGTC